MTESSVHHRLREWAGRSVAPDGVVADVTELRQGGPPWLLRIATDGKTVRAVLKAGRDTRDEIRTETAALVLAAEHDLAVPRVIAADLDGEETGTPAVLMTFVEGDARIPVEPEDGRLRAIGAAAAAIHQVKALPSRDLPIRHRHMPWIDFARERREGARPTSPLLDHADAVLRSVEPLAAETVFVHGDLWAGNTLWRDGTLVSTIDWEAAGVGAYGVDLGSLRLDAALMHGQAAADELTLGWTERFGEPPVDVAAWDLVAALNTPEDMADLVPTLPEAGRADLDAATLNARRDDFVRTAVEAVDAGR